MLAKDDNDPLLPFSRRFSVPSCGQSAFSFWMPKMAGRQPSGSEGGAPFDFQTVDRIDIKNGI
jgi:hypothetical protein